MMRLTTIALVVSDAKKSAKWYTEKLGFEIRDHQGHWITVAPKKENISFHLCEGYYPLEPGNSGISFVSKDVKKEEESLRKLGVQFTTPTTKEDWGTYAMFKDPDGNEFYILED
jgi:catechol 2,3-dioxygenase-like lactoylglutathione lyase family enzyme